MCTLRDVNARCTQTAHKHAHSPSSLRSSSSKDPFVLLAGREGGGREEARGGRGKGKGVGAGLSNWMSKRESVPAESNRDSGQPWDSSSLEWSLRWVLGWSLGWTWEW